MEWYWILLIIASFAGVVATLVYLGKSGKLTATLFSTIKAAVGIIDTAAKGLAAATENVTIDIFAEVSNLINTAVLAAENMWYNHEIAKEDRKIVCLGIFHDLLDARGIVLPQEMSGVLDYLIRQSCELMGHGATPAEV